jgi:hypothetical protein
MFSVLFSLQPLLLCSEHADVHAAFSQHFIMEGYIVPGRIYIAVAQDL